MLIPEIRKVFGSTKVYYSQEETMTNLRYNKISIPTWTGFKFCFLIFFPVTFHQDFFLILSSHFFHYYDRYCCIPIFTEICWVFETWLKISFEVFLGVRYRASINFGVSLGIIEFHLSKQKKYEITKLPKLTDSIFRHYSLSLLYYVYLYQDQSCAKMV